MPALRRLAHSHPRRPEAARRARYAAGPDAPGIRPARPRQSGAGSRSVNLQEEEDRELFVAIAEARNTGRLPADCTQQELVRLFGAKLPTVGRVMRHLSELGLVERKRGHGWSFVASINSASAQAESYNFRRILEPAELLRRASSSTGMGRACRARHLVFKRKPWRKTLAVEFFEMNADFHEQLARCSGNRYLLDAIQRQNQVRSFLNYQWGYGVERVRPRSRNTSASSMPWRPVRTAAPPTHACTPRSSKAISAIDHAASTPRREPPAGRVFARRPGCALY